MGAHGDAMVPMPRFSMVDHTSLTKLLPAEDVDALVARTVNGGAEVVGLLKTGSAFYAPGASVMAMAQAILGDTGETMPSCIYLNGKYGIKDVYMTASHTGRQGSCGRRGDSLDDAELAAVRPLPPPFRGHRFTRLAE
jgi:malate dehydrogenase